MSQLCSVEARIRSELLTPLLNLKSMRILTRHGQLYETVGYNFKK